VQSPHRRTLLQPAGFFPSGLNPRARRADDLRGDGIRVDAARRSQRGTM